VDVAAPIEEEANQMHRIDAWLENTAAALQRAKGGRAEIITVFERLRPSI
jgi:hypothetical protein